MCAVAVTIPDAVLYDINMTVADAQSFARRMTAAGLYRHNNVSLGYCAQIAEMSEADFIAYLGTQGIGIFSFQDEDELAMDVENALRVSSAAHA